MSACGSAEIRNIRDGVYTVGYFAACTCAWTGPERERAGQALKDIGDHYTVLAPKEKT